MQCIHYTLIRYTIFSIVMWISRVQRSEMHAWIMSDPMLLTHRTCAAAERTLFTLFNTHSPFERESPARFGALCCYNKYVRAPNRRTPHNNSVEVRPPSRTPVLLRPSARFTYPHTHTRTTKTQNTTQQPSSFIHSTTSRRHTGDKQRACRQS